MGGKPWLMWEFERLDRLDAFIRTRPLLCADAMQGSIDVYVRDAALHSNQACLFFVAQWEVFGCV